MSDPALRILSCALQKYGTLTSCVRQSRLLLLHATWHEHVLQHHMPCFANSLFTRVTSCSSSFQRCFVIIPLAIPVVRAYNSASAELKLTDCCVLDHADRVALPNCVTPPLVFLHVWCCLAQSLSVYTFTDCGNGTDFDQALCARDTFQVSCASCSSRRSQWCTESFVLLLHAVYDVITLLARVQLLSRGCPVHGSFLVLQLGQ